MNDDGGIWKVHDKECDGSQHIYLYFNGYLQSPEFHPVVNAVGHLFATHGQIDPDTPLKSALLLVPDARSNGMLTVDKIYSLNLNADHVTLNACETGLTKIANGNDNPYSQLHFSSEHCR